jgi:hypothetical protein
MALQKVHFAIQVPTKHCIVTLVLSFSNPSRQVLKQKVQRRETFLGRGLNKLLETGPCRGRSTVFSFFHPVGEVGRYNLELNGASNELMAGQESEISPINLRVGVKGAPARGDYREGSTYTCVRAAFALTIRVCGQGDGYLGPRNGIHNLRREKLPPRVRRDPSIIDTEHVRL